MSGLFFEFTARSDRESEEHIEIMKQAWLDDGWTLSKINVLKHQNAYKVTVHYYNATRPKGEGSFTETLWRQPDDEWKPTGVTFDLQAQPLRFLTVAWWRRSVAALQATLSGTVLGASTGGTAEISMLDDKEAGFEIPVPLTSSGSDSSEVTPVVKRMRASPEP